MSDRQYVFYNTDELMNLPPQEWLIQGVVREDGLALLFGPPAEGKSFVALDWALCVATGKPWLDKYPVKQGHVVYVAAEGGGGIRKRVAAWKKFHCITDVPEVTWYLDTLNFFEDGVIESFMRQLEERFSDPKKGKVEHRLDPNTGEWDRKVHMDLRLVIIDTLSRNFGGEDENSNAMSIFVAQVEKFAKKHGALVLTVHHTNAQGTKERGHTALRAGMQACFRCTATKVNKRIDFLELDNDKQKDDPDEDNIYMAPVDREGIALPELGLDGGKVPTSLVFEAMEKPEKKKDRLTPTQAQLSSLKPLTATQMVKLLVGIDGMSGTEWMLRSNNKRSTFYAKVKRLVKLGYVAQDPASKQWHIADNFDVDAGGEIDETAA